MSRWSKQGSRRGRPARGKVQPGLIFWFTQADLLTIRTFAANNGWSGQQAFIFAARVGHLEGPPRTAYDKRTPRAKVLVTHAGLAALPLATWRAWRTQHRTTMAHVVSEVTARAFGAPPRHEGVPPGMLKFYASQQLSLATPEPTLDMFAGLLAAAGVRPHELKFTEPDNLDEEL